MTRARATVMQVTPNLDVGGAQENLKTMAKYLPQVDCDSIVCTFADGPLRSEIETLGVPVEVLSGRRHSVLALPRFAVEMLGRRRALLGLVEKYGVTVVQTRGLGTLDFLLMTIRKRRKLQVWWTIENVHFMVREEHLGRRTWMLRPKRAVHRWLYRLGAHMIDGIVVVSDEAERSFREAIGYRGTKLTVVLNAVDVERYPARIDRQEARERLGFFGCEHLMTMVGTFKRQKGHRHLVAAFERIATQYPALQLVLVGDGELAGVIREQVRDAGLTERVHFLGTRRDVAEVLAASDSFVLPSLWEGLPIALIEAMASALPVIATDVSGTSQVMIDGRTGWLVAPGDECALAHAITAMLSDPSEAARRATAARQRVATKFNARSQARALAELFEDAG